MAKSSLLQQDELAEVLRGWDDEEDEVVEFIQHAPADRETRHRTENGSFHEHSERTTVPREKSTLTGKPLYAPYVRCVKAFCLFVSFLGLVSNLYN